MKIVTTTNKLGFEELVGELLEGLKSSSKTNNQKILEVCHTGKFLMHLESLRIAKLREKPDFILNDGTKYVGLEHQIIIYSDSKEREGKFQGIFAQVERELQADEGLPDFLVNCYVKPFVDFEANQKEALIAEMKMFIRLFVLTGSYSENTLIDRISIMPHSQRNVSVNLGAWWQRRITKEIIEQAVLKKENKIDRYIQETGIEQWLLLVIGGVGDSSYEMDSGLDITLNTKFSKVYLLEDFRNLLYELK